MILLKNKQNTLCSEYINTLFNTRNGLIEVMIVGRKVLNVKKKETFC